MLLLCVYAISAPAADLDHERAQMLRDIERTAAETADLTGHGKLAPGVLAAMERVPRHEFVAAGLRPYAYLNRPLPIEGNQTISQPFIVALMTDLLEVKRGDTVLEVGTGSGYQAAVLAEMGARVFSIEIIERLARSAAERLTALGYSDVVVRSGDGYQGWPEHAPFDGIIVTAAAPHVPQPLVEQLRVGGVLVVPVGPEGETQHLVVIRKRPQGGIETRKVLPVRFVPLTGER